MVETSWKGPSTSLRYAQDDRTLLRFAQDDRTLLRYAQDDKMRVLCRAGEIMKKEK